MANPSTANITKNLKGLYNSIFAPLLGAPRLEIYQDAYALQKAKLANMKNKVYAEGEKVPRNIAGFGQDLYGDGSGRSFKDGGYTPCRNKFDGKNPREGARNACAKFRQKYGQTWKNDTEGFTPRFVDMEKDFTGNYILRP
jgi:hypothetical protein